MLTVRLGVVVWVPDPDCDPDSVGEGLCVSDAVWVCEPVCVCEGLWVTLGVLLMLGVCVTDPVVV